MSAAAATTATGSVTRPMLWRLRDLGAMVATTVRASEAAAPAPMPPQTARARARRPLRPRPAAGTRRIVAPTASIVSRRLRVASLSC